MAFQTEFKVRFGETDLLGHVNNVSYFTYLEQARVDFFKAITPDPETEDWSYILASVKCDFRAQAYFDQRLKVITEVSRIGEKSFGLHQPVFDAETGQLIAEGDSTIVYFDFKEQKSKSIPGNIRAKLQDYQYSLHQ
ncbi:acyl-CoA thioester hydrolase [Scopulibacillus daqui]|uniref:Acyl-CoA thioester hydrolase n=1 Tax=Scopulibacillus daqui TaxID=1469162 RepID=A0ABS2Q200_9BACL|nr:acyl-CoA thioester hydrolase [Scopulibacillus daqui]